MEKYNHKYGAEQIQVLEGLEAVRKRPGMYIGSTSIRGLHHLVYEIVDNGVDEALAGYCTEINVIIEEGNVICVCNKLTGENYACEITLVSKEKIDCKIKEKLEFNSESNVKIDIFQGIPKSDKMELIIQKGTELRSK